jgi:pantetheine-phosphate adenylyltransferase
MMISAVYPGTFDPVTNGHLDVIERAAKIFDELIVAVTTNPAKTPWFTLEERVEMLKECCSHLPNVTVEAFDGLLVNFVRQKGAKVIIKGLRAVTDFDYEFQMAAINRKLAPEIETLFLMTSLPYAYLSSSAVKEVASLNGCLKDLVPDNVAERLRKKVAERRR